jgi:iron complex transport system ATP-binding protein
MSLLAAEGVSVGFPERTLLRDVHLRMQPGECWAILGNNGSGKTTLLHALAGLRRPLTGRVTLDGQDVSQMAPGVRSRALGLLLQEETQAFWGSVLDYVLLGRYPHRAWTPGWGAEDERHARRAIAQVDLHGREGRMLATCSGGERQRARLALLLAQDPQVLLLDEPLLHLDLRHQFELLELLRDAARRRGKTVVMVLHEPARARRFCDCGLLLFDDGSTASGPVAGLLERATLERLYGCAVEDASLQGGPAAGGPRTDMHV